MEDGNSALSSTVEETSIIVNVVSRSPLFVGYKGKKLNIPTT